MPPAPAHFQTWLSHIAPSQDLQIETLRLASADASFRRYFRIDSYPRSTDEGQKPISTSSWTRHQTRKTASLLSRSRA